MIQVGQQILVYLNRFFLIYLIGVAFEGPSKEKKMDLMFYPKFISKI
jgi:hypothetical protein